MAATTGPRKTISIYDYPEHLNPFREEDNHNKIRFWTIGRKLNRSNSITFSGIKDLKNSWALRSFMKKGKKEKQSPPETKPNQVNGESSPVVYRRALQFSSPSSGASARSTVGSPERPDRYVYGGSVTPLPRSRFQERLRSTSQYEVNSSSATPRMARSDVTGSRLSVESTNPFDEGPVPPVRASRRKKKRAPPPPSAAAEIPIDSAQTSTVSEKATPKPDAELEIEDLNCTIELKIVEDEDMNRKDTESITPPTLENDSNLKTSKDSIVSLNIEENCENKELTHEAEKTNEKNLPKEDLKSSDSENDILNKVSFPKIDIVKYRRNSSLNEDDIRLRRGNLEDFHVTTNKRSKSLTNALDPTLVPYDINLNEDILYKDTNGNEEPRKVICKMFEETARKQSIDNSISSTEKEFIEIDRATRELEREISKLNSALSEEDNMSNSTRLSVSDIRRKFDNNDVLSPNPIPKPRRSHYGEGSLVNGNMKT